MGRSVLVTRPEPGLSETMDAIAARGLRPIACPMLAIEHGSLCPVPAFSALVVTSGQAVPALARALAERRLEAGCRVFAVGDRTAQRLRDTGFTQVLSAGGDASGLATQIAAIMQRQSRLALITGHGEGMVLAGHLRACGFLLTRRVVYRARTVRTADPAVIDAWLADPMGALFFSHATARAFAQGLPAQFRRNLRVITAYALSAKVASGLNGLEWGAIRIAPRPNAASLLACLDQA